MIKHHNNENGSIGVERPKRVDPTLITIISGCCSVFRMCFTIRVSLFIHGFLHVPSHVKLMACYKNGVKALGQNIPNIIIPDRLNLTSCMYMKHIHIHIEF